MKILKEEYGADTKYLHDLLKLGVDDRGQTSLRKYLFVNRYNSSDNPAYVVHHIDCKHENYQDDNLALMRSGDHASLHKIAAGAAVKFFKAWKIKSDPQFDFMNLSEDDKQALIDFYIQNCKNLLNRYDYK